MIDKVSKSALPIIGGALFDANMEVQNILNLKLK